jgi:conjugal transfer pilus assembly protein TraE
MLVEIDLYRLGFLLLLVANSVLMYLFVTIKGEQKIIITPPIITKKFEVIGTKLSKSYFEQTGYYVSDRLFSVSPETINNSYDFVMPFFTTNPNHIKKVKDFLIKQADQIKENNIYQTFYPMKVTVNYKHSTFTVEGILRKMTGNTFIENKKKSIDYIFEINQAGKLEIINFAIR